MSRPYNQTDGDFGLVAEFTWAQLLSKIGTVGHHPLGKYGPDILLISNDRHCFVEVERRRPWKTGPLNFPTVDIFWRRIVKAATLPIPSLLLMSNQEMDHGALCVIPGPEDLPEGKDYPQSEWVNLSAEQLDPEAVWDQIDRAHQERE